MGQMGLMRMPDVAGAPVVSRERFEAGWMTGVESLRLADGRDPNSSGLALDPGLRLKSGTRVGIVVTNPLSPDARQIDLVFRRGKHCQIFPLGNLKGLPRLEHLQTSLNTEARVEMWVVDDRRKYPVPFLAMSLVICLARGAEREIYWGVLKTPCVPLTLYALGTFLEEKRVVLAIPLSQAARVLEQLRSQQCQVEMLTLSS